MTSPRLMLSTSLPLALLLLGLLAIGSIGWIVYVDARNRIVLDETRDTEQMNALLVGQLSYHLRNDRRDYARQVLDSIRLDRTVITATLLDDEARVLLSSPYQPTGMPIEQSRLAPFRATVKAVLTGNEAISVVSENRKEILVALPVILTTNSEQLAPASGGALVLYRDITRTLDARLQALSRLILSLSLLLAVALLGLWQVLRKVLFLRMRKLVDALETSGGLFDPPQDLTGHDELSLVAGALRDFTLEQRETRQRERAMLESLHNSERKYRSLFTDSPDAIMVNENERITMVNKACIDLFGARSEDDLLGKSPMDLFHPDYHEFIRERIHRMRDLGEDVGTAEEKIVRLDGTVVDVEVSPSSFETEQGLALHVILRDVSERVANQRELLYQRNFLKATLDSTADGIVACDADGLLATFNRTAQDWHLSEARAIAPDEWAQHYDLYHPDGETPLAADDIPLARAYRGEAVENVEMVIAPDKGPRRHVLASGRPVVDDEGNVLGAVASMQDITQRKQAERELKKSYDELERRVDERTAALAAANERLQELDRLKSMFIASMSHELRTPLNSIIGFAGLLQMKVDGPLNEAQADYVGRVKASGKLLLSLITDVIDVSKIEAGKITPYIEQVVLKEVIDEAVRTVQLDVEAKGLDLAVRCDPKAKAQTDRKRLLQCLLNYLNNAVKYSRSGSIRVEAQESGDGFRISVEDTGLGIPAAQHDRLFKQFSRINTPATVGIPGTGLGLYLTRNLVEQVLRGRVGFESEEGVGSTFWLFIPKEIAA